MVKCEKKNGHFRIEHMVVLMFNHTWKEQEIKNTQDTATKGSRNHLV